jgi:hypothetical protein
MTQTSVTEYRDQYIVGDIQDPSTCMTAVKIVDDSTNIVPGDVVVKASSENEVKGAVAAFTKATFRGVAVYGGLTNEKALTTGVNTYADNEPITILRKGVIPVLLGGTVTEGGTGFFVHTAGGASSLHTWRADLDTDKAAEVPGVYLQDGVSGETVLFQLEIAAGIGSVLT